MVAAKKNPKADEAYKLYKSGMKLVEIAKKLEVPDGTVRRWKNTYSWEGERSDKKSERSETKRVKKKLIMNDGTEDTLQNNELTPEQQMFCIYYSRTFNATQSYQKAYGCKRESAMARGCMLLKNVKVKEEIQRLQEIKRQQIVISEPDIVELQMRIAFADMGEYVTFGALDVRGKKLSSVKLKDSDKTDTQLIREVKEGKSGITIKLEDRQKAIDWLTKYFLMNPMDKHKQEFDRQKMELELLKLEMQTKSEEEKDNPVEDNFLEALNASAKEVWEDE